MTMTYPRHELVPHAYGASDAWTVGAEEEFMVVDTTTFDLAAKATDVLESCRAAGVVGVTPEVVQTVVEAATPICGTAGQIETALRASRSALLLGAESVGCTLGAAGTHPFSVGPQPVSEGARYEAVAADYPWITLEAATYGLHVHVGVPTADAAIRICTAMRVYLPHLLALSASSPFWRGETTGLQSTRVRLAQLCPRSGMPPAFETYSEYSGQIRTLVDAEAMPDDTHAWWYVRPHPRFGTVEVRICDGQADVRRSAALSALIQATCAWLGDLVDVGAPMPNLEPLLLEENLWRATRDGLDAVVVTGEAGELQPMRQAVADLVSSVTPWMQTLGSETYIPVLTAMTQRNEASELIALNEAGVDLAGVVAEIVKRTTRSVI